MWFYFYLFKSVIGDGDADVRCVDFGVFASILQRIKATANSEVEVEGEGYA
jgi:hypothetical protein